HTTRAPKNVRSFISLLREVADPPPLFPAATSSSSYHYRRLSTPEEIAGSGVSGGPRTAAPTSDYHCFSARFAACMNGRGLSVSIRMSVVLVFALFLAVAGGRLAAGAAAQSDGDFTMNLPLGRPFCL